MQDRSNPKQLDSRVSALQTRLRWVDKRETRVAEEHAQLKQELGFFAQSVAITQDRIKIEKAELMRIQAETRALALAQQHLATNVLAIVAPEPTPETHESPRPTS